MTNQNISNSTFVPKDKIETLFQSYMNKSIVIDYDNCVKFFKDIGVDCEKEIVFIYISQFMKAETLLQFTLEEF